ncbi:MAG: hypothetical protein J5898_07215, partial [Lachnospiraceae bacterium]|nr:hypothetical protein [Lachnospiraceae bacterium]
FIVILIIALVAMGFAISRWLKWKEPLRSIIGVGFILVILGVISYFQILQIVENKEFYQYKKEITKEFDYISIGKINNIGPHCIIDIYVKDEFYNYEAIEPVFIKAMTTIYQDSYFQYLKQIHGGEIGDLGIDFCDKYGMAYYRFKSNSDLDLWIYEGDSSKKFIVSDYVE